MKVYEKYTMTFEEFINEGKIVVKRKYTDKYPSYEIGKYGPVREKILSFVKEKGIVSREELVEYINAINEDIGSSTSLIWIYKNSKYFRVIEKEGKKMYKLSPLGEKTHAAILKQIT
jgi:hypothetical protein